MSLNLLQVMDWQRSNSEGIIKLLSSKQAWINAQTEGFFTDWSRDVFNLSTANEFGLFVWSIILDVPLFGASDVDPSNQNILFFSENGEPDNGRFNFGVDGSGYGANFGQNGAAPYNLTTGNKRFVLQIRAVELMTYHSTNDLNKRLRSVIGQDVFYYLETGLMSLTASFKSFDKYNQLALYLNTYNLFPRPTGVNIEAITYRG